MPRTSDDDPNRIVGPLLRSDLISLICWASSGYLFDTHRWPVIAGFTVAGGIFAGLSPRMKGRFGLQAWSIHIGGTFQAPSKPPRINVRAVERNETRPTTPPALPPGTKPGVD
jgi:hypothetical protein